MAKEARELEQAFLSARLPTRRAQISPDWMQTLEAAGLQKNNEIVKWLKSEKGFNHYASLNAGGHIPQWRRTSLSLSHALPESYSRVKSSSDRYMTPLPLSCRPQLPSMLFIPTKTYVSLEDERVFGCAKINKTNIRVGLDLGDEPFGDYVRKGVGLGAMPNITHMIELKDAGPDRRPPRRLYASGLRAGARQLTER